MAAGRMPADVVSIAVGLAFVLARIDSRAVKISTIAAVHAFAPDLTVWRQLFDHLPDTVFFAKDTAGRYLVINETLARRCALRDPSEAIGRTVAGLFPARLAERYAAQDAAVLRDGRPILERLELHWLSRGRDGWCLTTKLPVRDAHGRITGLIGVSRDLRAPGDSNGIPAGLATAVEHLENHYMEPLTPADLARLAGLPAVRFARLIKRILRISPVQWIAQTRLSAAAHLLRETDRSVAEIAISCGYYDHSAFTRAFRSATDMTPSEFRRNS